LKEAPSWAIVWPKLKERLARTDWYGQRKGKKS